MRAVIVDDEGSARAGIRALLAGERDVRVVAECRTAAESLRQLIEWEPDLLFLDVQLAGSTGIELLERIPDSQFPIVIFVTAYESYAMKAFDHHAVDYLLKPYTDERFRVALGRARARFQARVHETFHRQVVTLARRMAPVTDAERARTSFAAGEHADTTSAHETTIAVRTGSRIALVRASDIDWVEADGDYVRIHSRGKCLLHRSTMGELEDRLDANRFVRVHRSTIVRISAVLELRQQANESYVAVLADGSIRPLSERGRARLVERLGGHL